MALTERAKELEKYLDNPNVRAYLETIGKSEGATFGYRTAFGGKRLDSLADHPRASHSFTNSSGKKLTTTAAGKYQFTQGTWDEEAKRLGLEDFGPHSQDLAALDLIARHGALDEIAQGDFAAATSKLGSTWASLPSSIYDQPTRSQSQFAQMLQASIDDQIAAGQDGVVTPDFDNLVMDAEPEPKDLPEWARKIIASRDDEQDQQLPAQDRPDLSNMAPWEVRLISEVLGQQADEARRNAQADFFGDTISPNQELPAPLERAINASTVNM